MIERKFTSRQAAELAGINPATFRSYFKSGHFRVIGSMERKEAAKNGLANIYGWNDVMCFAAAQALIEFGVHPKAAFEGAAFDFAYTGDGDRDPGAMYDVREKGYTFLAFNHVSGACRVFAADDAFPLFSALADFNGGAGHGLFVLLNKVERDVHHRLHSMASGTE